MKKLMIASDIHGSATYCRALLDAFEREGAEHLLLLGDVLYHGPRNDLPDGYAPKEVIALLSPYADRILAVRGNCDTEVDQMVLPFPVLADYAWVMANGRTLFLTHGHKYTDEAPPPLPKDSILLSGHTHVPHVRPHEGFLALNPGSVSIPKEGSHHSYLLFEENVFRFMTLSGEEWDRVVLD